MKNFLAPASASSQRISIGQRISASCSTKRTDPAVPIDDCLSVADFTIAGCHKWLRGYFPLGIVFFGQPNSSAFIADMASSMLITLPSVFRSRFPTS